MAAAHMTSARNEPGGFGKGVCRVFNKREPRNRDHLIHVRMSSQQSITLIQIFQMAYRYQLCLEIGKDGSSSQNWITCFINSNT